MRAKLSLAVASVLVSVLAATAPAEAACKRFGFTVNDYGKEGPTNDAKNLLDKHIAEWAAQNGVTAYQTGKKNVSCELFLDVILFDEHTCTASANVCWGDGVKPNNKGAEQAEATRRWQRRNSSGPGEQSRSPRHSRPAADRCRAGGRCRSAGRRRRPDGTGRADCSSGRDAGGDSRRADRHSRDRADRARGASRDGNGRCRDRRPAGWPRPRRKASRSAGGSSAAGSCRRCSRSGFGRRRCRACCPGRRDGCQRRQGSRRCRGCRQRRQQGPGVRAAARPRIGCQANPQRVNRPGLG